jgi:hypothetical protein
MRGSPDPARPFAWLVASVLVVALGPTVHPATGQGKSSDVTLVKADGTALRIPSSGPLANPMAQGVARDIAAFDRQKSLPGLRGASPEVAEAVRRLAQESRNEAVDQLDTTYRVASSTSAGVLDIGLLQAARQSVDVLKQILSSPSPPSLQVRTEVDASSPNAVLHYCLRADYRRAACAWQSYTFGATVRIGLYMFRVQSDGAVVGEEQVLVLNEPTKVTIRPVR